MKRQLSVVISARSKCTAKSRRYRAKNWASDGTGHTGLICTIGLQITIRIYYLVRTSDVAGATKSVVSCNPFLDGSKTHNLPQPLRACTYVRTSPRTLVSRCTPSLPIRPPVLYPPLRSSHDGGRNMQICEINARKFHYNSTRKISSSSCNPTPTTPSFLTPLVTTSVSLASTPARNGGLIPLLAILSGRQEHPHYLVLPHSPRKMAEKVTGKTVRRPLETVSRWLLHSAKPAYFLVRRLFLLALLARRTVAKIAV